MIGQDRACDSAVCHSCRHVPGCTVQNAWRVEPQHIQFQLAPAAAMGSELETPHHPIWHSLHRCAQGIGLIHSTIRLRAAGTLPILGIRVGTKGGRLAAYSSGCRGSGQPPWTFSPTTNYIKVGLSNPPCPARLQEEYGATASAKNVSPCGAWPILARTNTGPM